jgi:branched-chain amino acid transport system ATP-binding protein
VTDGPRIEHGPDVNGQDAAPVADAAGTAHAPRPTAPAPTREALRIDELSVPRGGRPVLHDVSLEIPPGQVTALLGPNGTGKSTLVLAVAGVLRPTAGHVFLGDQELTRKRPERIRRAGVAVVPEGRRLLPELSVADNLRVATYSLSREEAERGTQHVLNLFPELEARWDTTARSLSGGQQQMVVLAQALASNPAVLLVDELSLGLAPLVVKRLVPTLAEVAASGVGVLLIEQFAHVALGLANKAYILQGGRIRYDGTAQALRDDPELLHSAYLLRV